jgi:hypothetical protein
VIWQCTCSARIECDLRTKSQDAEVLVEFIKMHEQCPETWAKRWRPDGAREDSTRDTVSERSGVGFYADVEVSG